MLSALLEFKFCLKKHVTDLHRKYAAVDRSYLSVTRLNDVNQLPICQQFYFVWAHFYNES